MLLSRKASIMSEVAETARGGSVSDGDDNNSGGSGNHHQDWGPAGGWRVEGGEGEGVGAAEDPRGGSFIQNKCTNKRTTCNDTSVREL